MEYQFKIQIKNITHPPVWRSVCVPSHFTFEDLHFIIQISFGWENAHLFQFSPNGFGSWPQIKEKFDDDLDFGPGQGEVIEPHEIKLSDIFISEGQKFIYIYDFGDSWEHVITLEKILPDNRIYPKINAGKSQCPPEDCGGPWGYMQLKEILEDPSDPEFESYTEWLGLEENENWDPKYYDLEYHQQLLIEFFTKH